MPTSSGLSSTALRLTINIFQIRLFCLVLSIFCLLVTGFLTIPSVAQAKASVLGVVTGKEGYNLRYSKTTNGGMIFAGNSLCLAGNADYGSCATYTSLDSKSKDASFSPLTGGTTADWTQNGGFTNLNIPDGSSILYAELIWSGNYKYLDQSVEDKLDNAVKLTLPNGQVKDIKPVSETAAVVQQSSTYVRTSGDIKDLISISGKGKYSVSAVPSLMVQDNPYNNFVGFTLAVVYYNQNEPARSLSLFTSSEQVGPDQLTNTAEVKGFSTPTSGAVSGKLFVSSSEGDSVYSGDRLKFGSSTSTLTDLQGPNNKISNFFASQINNSDGLLDKTGSFGNRNQGTSSNKAGNRQGWDVTAVSLNNNLVSGQTSAFARATSTGDTYLINALGMQIEVNSALPKINLQLQPQVDSCQKDLINIKLTVTNSGSATSNHGTFSNFIPAGFSLVDNSVLVGQNKLILDGPSLNIPDLAAGQSLDISYTLRNNGGATSLGQNPKFDYQYTMMTGLDPISASQEISTASIDLSQTCKPNLPPTTLDDTGYLLKNTPIIVDVLKNDSDPENALDTNSLDIVTLPTNGQVLVQNNQLSYIPNQDYIGTDQLTYKICDLYKNCTTANLILNVVDIKVSADSSSVAADGQVSLDVLNNDTFQGDVPDLSSLKIITNSVSGATNVDNVTGKINYNAANTASGLDSFDYQICMKISGFCGTGHVDVQINQAKPQPPVAVNDEAKTDQGKPIIIDVLKNDQAGTASVSTLSIAVTSIPTNGTVEINNQTGQIQYSPYPSFSGSDLLTYKVCDPNQLCSSAEVSIQVQQAPSSLTSANTQNTNPGSTPTPTPAVNQNTNQTGLDNTQVQATNTPVQPKNIIVEAFKPIPQVLDVSELVRSGGQSTAGIILFSVLSVSTAVIFVWLSLMPEHPRHKKLREVSHRNKSSNKN